MHLFLKKIYRKNPFPKIYRINQCEVLNTCSKLTFLLVDGTINNKHVIINPIKATASKRVESKLFMFNSLFSTTIF